MLEGRTVKSLVFSSEFMADRSAGGGTVSLRSAKSSHPPALVTRALSFPSGRKI
jgi:hypothetical protein